MIIGKNNNNLNNRPSFSDQMKNNSLNNNIKPNIKNDFGFKENINNYNHTNPMNDMAMYDKSIAVLKDRYEKGLINVDEFNKKCEQIGKNRANSMNNKHKF